MGKVALTEQQQEIARYYKAKVSVRQIADLLGISTQRVYQHLERLRELGVIR
jgi:DNA-binding CsgD family transcriptional regulator